MLGNAYTGVHVLIDSISEALEKQGVKSCLSEDSYLDRQYCMYKDPRGNKCAVGHIIPTSKYRSVLEHLDASDVCIKYPSIVDSIKRKYKLTDVVNITELLIKLQNIHDFNEPEDWKQKFIELKGYYV